MRPPDNCIGNRTHNSAFLKKKLPSGRTVVFLRRRFLLQSGKDPIHDRIEISIPGFVRQIKELLVRITTSAPVAWERLKCWYCLVFYDAAKDMEATAHHEGRSVARAQDSGCCLSRFLCLAFFVGGRLRRYGLCHSSGVHGSNPGAPRVPHFVVIFVPDSKKTNQFW